MFQKHSCAREVGLTLALGAAFGAASISPTAQAEDVPPDVRVAFDNARDYVAHLPFPSQAYFQTPIDAIPQTTKDGVGATQYWEGPQGRGAFVWSPKTGVRHLYGPVLEKWVSLGSEAVLGYPIFHEFRTDENGGLGRFVPVNAAGDIGAWSAIVFHPDYGSHAVTGPIHDLWNEEQMALIYPTTDEHDATPEEARRCAEGDRVQRFRAPGAADDQIICWNAVEGARYADASQEAANAIEWAYRRAGWQIRRDYLGSPETDSPQGTPDGFGAAWYFEPGKVGSGAVLWSPVTGAGVVYGSIFEHWLKLGGERLVGYPTSSGRLVRSGAAQVTQFVRLEDGAIVSRAAIVSDPQSGTHAITGAMHTLWNVQASRGAGLIPTDDQHGAGEAEAGACTQGDLAQSFRTADGAQKSVICWNQQAGARLVQL